MVKRIIQKGIDRGKKLIRGKQESIISAAFIMMVLVAFTKLAGFFKVHLFARFFGASKELDVFWAAFTIPDLIFFIIVSGSINAALIPSFTAMLKGSDSKNETKDMAVLFSKLVNFFAVVFIVLGVLVFVFAPQLSQLLASGGLLYEGNSDFSSGDIQSMASLMRIMTASPILLAVSSVFTAGLQANKRFFVPAMAPLFYNIGIILGALVFSEIMGMGVNGLAWGVVLGSVLHLLVQLPLAGRIGLIIRAFVKFWDKEVWGVIRLAIPRSLGLLGEQLNVLVNTVISMGLGEGSLSAYKFGSSLHLLPVQLLAATISQAALPTLSLDYQSVKESGDWSNFKRIFVKSFHQILFFILPSVVFILVLRLPIVRLALGAGEFDWEDTVVTSWVLALFSLAIIGQAVASLVVRAYYAMHETVIPVIVSFITLAVNIVGSIFLTNFFSHYYDWRPLLVTAVERPEGFSSEFWADLGRWLTTRNSSTAAVGGLALSTGIALTVELIILLVVLNKKFRFLTWSDFFKPILRKIFACLVMFWVMYSIFKFWNFGIDTSTVISIVGLFAVVGGVGTLVYLCTCVVIDVNEVSFFVKLLRKGRDGVKKVFSLVGNGNGK